VIEKPQWHGQPERDHFARERTTVGPRPASPGDNNNDRRNTRMQPITLTLPYPISANRYWATRTVPAKGARKAMAMTYVTPEAKAYKATVERLVRATGITKPLAGRVQLDVKLFPHRPLDWQTRQRKLGAAWDDGVQCLDLDNANKVLLDSLKDVAIEDDKWVRRLTSERMEPDGEARVVVTITTVPVVQPQADLLAEAA
jgi:crossover junction endodeoxyribonuclease RusA